MKCTNRDGDERNARTLSQCPGVSLSLCPGVPVSQSPGVPFSHCPSLLVFQYRETHTGGTETRTRGDGQRNALFCDRQSDTRTEVHVEVVPPLKTKGAIFPLCFFFRV